MPSSPGALPIGSQVGSYAITGAIGAGGMGEVYRAHDSTLNRDVALKVLPALVAADPDRLSRFRREAQVLAALNHPHIAQIYGLEESGSVHALVMELVPGRTLDELITIGQTGSGRRGLPVTDVLAIARQIADALETAHEQGIVHRDLKPANVKVRDDGTVKVLDFGLAKALDPTASAVTSIDPTNSPTLTARSTQIGVILGTAAYMSPEQAKGRPVDRRADIWAFGVVLYEMLTGDRAFKGEDISETLASVLKETPTFDALPPDVPPRLRRLIADCLVRDPRQRLRDIGDARLTIEKLIGGKDEEGAAVAPVAPAPPRSTIATLVPWGIAAIAVIGAGIFAWRGGAPPPSTPEPVTRARVELKVLSGFVEMARDGSRLVYTVTGGPQGFYLALREMNEFDARPIQGSDGGLFSVLSPDGRTVAYTFSLQNPKLERLPIGGGTPTTLCDGSFQNGGTWTDDDTIIFPSRKGLMHVPAAGGTPQTLTTIDDKQGESAHVRPQALPNGELLFTITKVTPGDPPQFAILDRKTGRYATVAPGGDNGRYVSAGYLTFVRGGTLYAVPFDLAKRSALGPEVPVIQNVATLGPQGTADYAVSQQGLLAFIEAEAASGTILAWANRKGELTPMTGQTGRQWGTGRLSPDGTQVANVIFDEKSGSDIWVFNVERGTPTRVTFDGRSSDPIWAPDSRTVLFGRTEPGAFGVFSVAADGTGKPVRVLATERESNPNAATPDGQTLVYAERTADGKSRLFVLPPAGADAKRTPAPLHETTAAEGGATISPDGTLIAYWSSESGSSEVYVHRFPGPAAKIRVSSSGGAAPRWSKQGRELLYRSTLNAGIPTMMSVSVETKPALQAAAPVELFKMMSGSTWDVAPGGEKLLVEALAAPSAPGATMTRLATVTNWFDELRARAAPKAKK